MGGYFWNCYSYFPENVTIQSSSSSSSDFLLMYRYRGNIHISGPPSRYLACCTHGRSHTRSPGISIMRVDSQELPLSAIPLCQLLPCHLGPPHQPVCQKLSWLNHWSIPPVHSSGVSSPSEWSPDLQFQAAQVAHWIWWWQYLAAWYCRSLWSLPCHFTADVGGLALSMAKSHWHGALHSAHKSCTHGHMSWKRGGGKRELVAAPWTSSWRFSHVLWLKVHSRWCLRACLLGSKRKLPPPAFRSDGLPSVVCHPRGMQDPGIMYICNHGPLSSTWAHCISCAPSACSHSRRCCCCPFQCGRRHMGNHLNSAWGPGQYTADHDLHLSCI